MASIELLHSQLAAVNAAGYAGSSSDQGASCGGRGTAASGRGRGAAGGRGSVGARGGHSAAISGGCGVRAGRSAGGGHPPIPPYRVPRPTADSGEYDVEEQGEDVDDVQGHDALVRLVISVHVNYCHV
jgi:hypothetical protein